MKKSVLMVTIFLILFAPGRAAAQLKLFVGGAVTEPVKRVDAEFAKKSGHRSDITSDTSGALQNKLRSSEKADVIIISAPAMDALEKEKSVKLAGTLPDAIQLQTIYSGAVPVGAPNPDAARAFLQAMKAPVGVAAIKEAGMESISSK